MASQLPAGVVGIVVVSAAGILCGCHHGSTTESPKGYPMPAKTVEQTGVFHALDERKISAHFPCFP
jgi:hypothetical protein